LLYDERDSNGKVVALRRLIAALAVAVGLMIPAAASAAGPYSAPGYEHAIANTKCADHGAFGYFGEKGAVHDFGTNNPGTDGKPGANGQATGDANSQLCGNPQS
jgi:hypothetical protein